MPKTAASKTALYALARWGARTLGPPGPKDDLYPGWGLNAFAALLDPEAAHGLAETYVLRIEEDVYSVRLESGQVHVEPGETENADLDVAMDMGTFYELASSELTPRTALAEGRVQLNAGKPATLERFFTVFSFAPRAQVAV